MIANKLETILQGILESPEFNMEKNGDEALKNHGLDSIEAINLLFELEEGFDITIPDEYLMEESFYSANSLKAMVEEIMALQLNQ
jgi:acyl carrier protein